MFKKIVVSFVVLLSFATSVIAADLKVGIINTRLVISKIPQTELVDSKVQAQLKDSIDEVKKLLSEFKKKEEGYKRDAMTMTESQSIEANRELEKMVTEIKAKQKNLKEDAQRARQAEMNKIFQKIQAILNKLAVDEKYDLILNSDAVVFRAKAIDISDKVISKLSDPAG
ncbi:MAG: OmpH family outer membrane protein [Enterobacterales bacterium]|nr:OmpH family outer membrane protein [Enterobacterales bacterium]